MGHSEDLTGDNFYNTMYAEFAYAGFFPPVDAMGSEWFDGSTIWDLDIFSAVNKCLEDHDDKDVVVDVVMTSAKTNRSTCSGDTLKFLVTTPAWMASSEPSLL